MNTLSKVGAVIGSLVVLATAAPALAQTGQSFCPQISVNLSVGARGDDVVALQNFLTTRGYAIPVTGYYGAITRNIVRQLQQSLGVSATGYFGPLTRQAVVSFCSGPVQPTPTSALNVNGPTSLGVNSSGTWTVSANSSSALYILWGDGQYSTGTGQALSFSHSFATAGTYAIRAFAVDAAGNSRTAQTSVSVSTNPPPIGGLTVTSPTAGQIVTTGSTLPITWNYPVTPGSASMIIDLYTAAGVKVGTIAISNQTIGTYNWHVPPFPNNLMCTLQFPNGLCGSNLEGQYYIQASAVSGTGFESNPNVIATGKSGVFTIQHPGSTTGSVSASPTSGSAPLTVTFSPGSYSGYYMIDFGDGSSASLLTGTTQHTYVNRGTYTAQFSSDAVCFHTTPRCLMATQLLGSVVITVQ